MTDLQFILNGVNDVPPTEWQGLELQLNWDLDHPSASLSTSKFTFEEHAAKVLNQWVEDGTNSGVGIFEGAPYQIVSCDNLTILEGCVDTADASAEYSCSKVVAPIRDTRIRDYLTDNWDGFSFAYLASGDPNITTSARISTGDYIDIPYTISEIPNYTQLLSTGLAIFTIEQQIADVIRTIGDLVAEFADPFTTAVAVAKIVIYLIYLTVVVIAIIKLVQLFIDCIFQFAKYKKGMYIRTLFQKGCAHLGITTFSSSIVNNVNSDYYNAATIPKKIQQYDIGSFTSFKRPVDEAGSTTAYGYEDGTFGEFCKRMENLFKAKCRLLNGVFYFEREDSYNNQSSVILPDLDLLGVNNGTYQYNTGELVANYYASYQIDSTEWNTMDDFGGTNAQMMATPTVINNPKNNLLRGLTRVDFYYALAKRKEQLTVVEKALNAIINGVGLFANTIINIINAIGSINIPTLPTNILNNRIGWLLLSADYFNTPKFLVLDSANKVDVNNRSLTSAETMLNSFHYTCFPLTNQWLVYTGWEIPFCCEDYIALLNNNMATTFDGRVAKFTNVRWQIGTKIATVDFKVRPTNNVYTTNITQVILTDNG